MNSLLVCFFGLLCILVTLGRTASCVDSTSNDETTKNNGEYFATKDQKRRNHALKGQRAIRRHTKSSVAQTSGKVSPKATNIESEYHQPPSTTRTRSITSRYLSKDKESDDDTQYSPGVVIIVKDENTIEKNITKDITKKNRTEPTTTVVLLQLHPFTIELNQGVWEKELRKTLVQYLTDTMILNEYGNESIKLKPTKQPTISGSSSNNWNFRFYYEGNLTSTTLDGNTSEKQQGSENSTSNDDTRRLFIDESFNESRIFVFDPSIMLLKQELALQDYVSLSTALRKNAYELTTNFSSMIPNNNTLTADPGTDIKNNENSSAFVNRTFTTGKELLQVTRIDVITDQDIMFNGWDDDDVKELSAQPPIRNVHPDLMDEGNNENDNATTLSNNTNTTEHKLRHKINDWFSSVIQDFDASTTESQLMLGTVGTALLMILLLVLWILIRMRSSSRRKIQATGTGSLTDNINSNDDSDDPERVMKDTDEIDEDNDNHKSTDKTYQNSQKYSHRTSKAMPILATNNESSIRNKYHSSFRPSPKTSHNRMKEISPKNSSRNNKNSNENSNCIVDDYDNNGNDENNTIDSKLQKNLEIAFISTKQILVDDTNTISNSSNLSTVIQNQSYKHVYSQTTGNDNERNYGNKNSANNTVEPLDWDALSFNDCSIISIN